MLKIDDFYRAWGIFKELFRDEPFRMEANSAVIDQISEDYCVKASRPLDYYGIVHVCGTLLLRNNGVAVNKICGIDAHGQARWYSSDGFINIPPRKHLEIIRGRVIMEVK